MGLAGAGLIVGGSETRAGKPDLTALPLVLCTARRACKVGDGFVGSPLARRFAQRSRICCCLEASSSFVVIEWVGFA